MVHQSVHKMIMKIPDHCKVLDLTQNYDPVALQNYVDNGGWGIGGYMENRKEMYTAPHFGNRRKVHMGIDVWATAGEPVFSPLDGKLVYKQYHEDPGNYGGTIVLAMNFEGETFYALYGHLSRDSVEKAEIGKEIRAGEEIGRLGDFDENGNWPPHLHFQISVKDPGEADMPGVVAEEETESASIIYPDPRNILGPIY